MQAFLHFMRDPCTVSKPHLFIFQWIGEASYVAFEERPPKQCASRT